MKVRLEVVHGKANVKRVVLRSGAVIGRSKDCNLRIASSQVSRRHCEISMTEQEVRVRDLGSSNGTFINGERIEANEDVVISPGSELSLGGVKFVVRFDLPGSGSPQPGSTVDLPPPAETQSPAAGKTQAVKKVEDDKDVSEDVLKTAEIDEPPLVVSDEAENSNPVIVASDGDPPETEQAESVSSSEDEMALRETFVPTQSESLGEASEEEEAFEIDDETADKPSEQATIETLEFEEPVAEEIAASVTDEESPVLEETSLDEEFELEQPGFMEAAAPSGLPDTVKLGEVAAGLATEEDSEADAAANAVQEQEEVAQIEDAQLEEDELTEEPPRKKGKLKGLFGMLRRNRPSAKDEETVDTEQDDGEDIGGDVAAEETIEFTEADVELEDVSVEEEALIEEQILVEEVGDEMPDAADEETELVDAAEEIPAEASEDDVASFLTGMDDNANAESDSDGEETLGDFLNQFGNE